MIEAERYFADPVAGVATVRGFLGASPMDLSADNVHAEMEKQINSRAHGQRPDPDIVARLEGIFRPYNAMLARLLAKHGLGNVSWAS